MGKPLVPATYSDDAETVECFPYPSLCRFSPQHSHASITEALADTTLLAISETVTGHFAGSLKPGGDAPTPGINYFPAFPSSAVALSQP